ncbi:substrate-binding domain-containing protein [Tindallia californiensis]|uniref:Tungstate transport system substrate-binding protein n=1 Tax=Tindallia californiensis TaxID=159292 RepID=A0A1H3PWL3_9FIRM|nr:substrate-binding domain-containing protein [Tindallia californiensis]SDZ05333.1 tungstate transport system substrate-binding protein [Tindallia californiensis]
MKLNKSNRLVLMLVLLLPFMASMTACRGADEPAPVEDTDEFSEVTETAMILATTTSTENSGLLDFILPSFEEKYGIDVMVVSVGTGAALQMGVDGEADVLLAHATAQEEELVTAGDTVERFDVMYNDFILVGPASDPAGLRENAASDILTGFQLMAENETSFVSRADNSGTHMMELSLWEEAGVGEPSGGWYIEAGQGMGDVIQISNELEGHTLTDRATYLSMLDTIDLEILLEGDEILFNQYGVMAVNPDKGDHINFPAAEGFVDWVLAPETQDLIAAFGIEEFGEPLFFPNAN